jgi:3alpha(or 20beta)-hydroxysteroid dehydrogenase
MPAGQGPRVVLVTGGARGQGAAHARRFAASGAHVFVADVLDPPGGQLVDDLRRDGAQATYRHLDVTRADDWHDTVEEISSLTGRLDVLVNNAGIAQGPSRLLDVTSEEWDRVFAVNVKGALLGIQAVAALMRLGDGGAIVNVGSSAALTGNPLAAYTSSKWALRGLTKAAAFELAGVGIRVNAVHPGIVATPMVEGAPERVEAMRQHTPLRRVASSAEVAGVVFFLAGSDAAYLTGIDVAVDGGFTELGPFWNMFEPIHLEAAR